MQYRDDLFEDEGATEASDDYRVRPEDFKDLFVIPTDWTVSVLRQEMENILDLEPEFQRRSVWSRTAKSRFIESLALGIPIPQILLAESKDGRGQFLVLDGKQRLLTILEFFRGFELDGGEFKLTGLSDIKEINNKTWREIQRDSPHIARLMDSATIRTAVIRGWQRDDVLYEIFHRLNSGSVSLSPMELRMALIRGPFIREVIRQTSVPSQVHRLLRLRGPDKRMADVELAIRFMAFSDQSIVYRGNLKDFLDQFCRHQNNHYDAGLVSFKLSRLDEAIKMGMTSFGDYTFCRKYNIRTRMFEAQFNRAVFDVMAGSFQDEQVRNFALNNLHVLPDAFVAMCGNREFAQSIESTTKSVWATRTRFEMWYETVNDITGSRLIVPEIADAEFA